MVQRIKQGAGHGAAQAHGSSIGRGVGAAIERRWPGLDDNRTEIEVVPQAQVGGLRAFQIVFAPKVDTGQQRGQREPAPAVPTLGSTAHWSVRAESLYGGGRGRVGPGIGSATLKTPGSRLCLGSGAGQA